MNTICILSQSHLCRNPRVLKEALTLAQQGYQVHIVTGVYSEKLLLEDKGLIAGTNIAIHIIADLSGKTASAMLYRALNKSGRLLVKYLNYQNSLSLGYGSYKYVKKCRAINAGLYICHQELATYIGIRLMAYGLPVAFDFEDWYSEDLLEEAQRERPLKLLQKAEAQALSFGVFCYTTSQIMAEKLSEAYHCKKPAYIYNVFKHFDEIPKNTDYLSRPLKLFWFSQTIGPGRGIEAFIEILGLLNANAELHLLGQVHPGYEDKIRLMIPERYRLTFHPLVKNEKLAAKIAEFDIGLALEMDKPLSRKYTITNKFFQYIQAGLPVISSNTPGQNEVFDRFLPGFKISLTPAAEDIRALDKWLASPAALQQARQNAITAANYYNWESESLKLINLTNRHFDQTS